jgi:ABC-2 type transport system permease protein
MGQPMANLLTVVATALSGQRVAWPWVLALIPALLSVVGPIPGLDPQKRGGNLLGFGDDGAQAGQAFLMLLLVPLTALPAVAVMLAGTLLDQPRVAWAGVPAGMLAGALFAWLLGGIAQR